MISFEQKYSVGQYNELPEGTLSNNELSLLASTLAWAAKNDVPFHEAIQSLTETGTDISGFFETGWNRPILFHIFPDCYSWNDALMLACRDLIGGHPLHTALRNNLSYFIPEYYLQAVEKAEKAGNLAEILPHFPKRLNMSSKINNIYRIAVATPCAEFIVAFGVLIFMSIFIFPNFRRLFDELAAGDPMPLDFIYDISVGRWFSSLSGYQIMCIIFIPIVAYVIYRCYRTKILMLLEEVIILIPYIRPQLQDIATMELAASLASYLSSGEDIVSAAKFSYAACRHYWMRRKLNKFINLIEKGMPWLDAWRKAKLSRPLNESILRNAAARENIIDGFDIITDWLFHRTIRNTRNNSVWLYMLFLCITASIVFIIVFAVFSGLIKIIEALSL